MSELERTHLAWAAEPYLGFSQSSRKMISYRSKTAMLFVSNFWSAKHLKIVICRFSAALRCFEDSVVFLAEWQVHTHTPCQVQLRSIRFRKHAKRLSVAPLNRNTYKRSHTTNIRLPLRTKNQLCPTSTFWPKRCKEYAIFLCIYQMPYESICKQFLAWSRHFNGQLNIRWYIWIHESCWLPFNNFP